MKNRTLRKIICAVMIAMYACSAFEKTESHSDYAASQSVAFVEVNR